MRRAAIRSTSARPLIEIEKSSDVSTLRRRRSELPAQVRISIICGQNRKPNSASSMTSIRRSPDSHLKTPIIGRLCWYLVRKSGLALIIASTCFVGAAQLNAHPPSSGTTPFIFEGMLAKFRFRILKLASKNQPQPPVRRYSHRQRVQIVTMPIHG